jgi:hypothetical protein
MSSSIPVSTVCLTLAAMVELETFLNILSCYDEFFFYEFGSFLIAFISMPTPKKCYDKVQYINGQTVSQIVEFLKK